ncbi:RES family NAD+ phosphorylase [Paraburkholderia sp. 22B1P]|uniref:RES family NAD+ phosphorylase n=1 Tax=Paraburkholderia sp. 22B1P TaxID=3080498 RepID=UPI0030856D55|nr:RES family NAD+ phosphorylase [Paraburkholderia sp. 22B1P]
MIWIPAPRESEEFVLEEITREDVPEWYHVYSVDPHPNTASSFAKGWGDTRFAPLKQPDATPVHTYYAASTFNCAIMESVFHDIPLNPAGSFDLDRLDSYQIARIAFDDPIQCVSFHSPYLPALGLERHRLIESLPAFYPQTRQWAQAAFDQRPDAQGIAYGSRRHDAGRCIMLFGQRIPGYPDKPFNVIEHVSLAELPARSKVVKLAASLKIGMV